MAEDLLTHPNEAATGPPARLHPALSHAALAGVGLAAQHFHGGSDFTIGRVLGSDEHRILITTPGEDGIATNHAVGRGDGMEAALHDTLTQMRSQETLHTKSLVRMQMTEIASVDFTSLEHYKPRIAPSTESYPIPSYLEEFLADDGESSTYQNTVAEAGWERKVRGVLEDYITHDSAGQKLVADLKIQSLDHLTPEQAIKLSSVFVQNVSKYSYADTQATAPTRADQATTVELLREGMANKDDSAWQGNGVCRNIAANVKAVFESLKRTQGELSMLNNTYAIYGGGDQGAGYADSRNDSFTHKMSGGGHAWNTFVTIDAAGSAVATITDATWALGKDADTAIQALDRTEVRAAAQLVRLFAKSERKPDAFEWFSYYLDNLARHSATDRRLPPTMRDNLREYTATEYLSAAAQLPEIPEGHTIPTTLMGAMYRMRGKLEHQEIETLYSLDTAGGSLEQERLKSTIAGYDKDRAVPLPAWKQAENLVFKDDGLQALAYEAVGTQRVAELAETSGAFRIRLRQQHPEMLPAFDPYTRPADSREFSHIASENGIHEKDPDTIRRRMEQTIRRLAGDASVYDAVIAGRSMYDLALNYRTITTALRKRQNG